MDTEVQTPQPDVRPPEDDSLLGHMTPEEREAIAHCRQESARLAQTIGEFEIRKSRAIAQFEQVEQNLQGIVNSISRRLGVQDGQQWSATVDGAIRLVKPQGVAQTGGKPPE